MLHSISSSSTLATGALLFWFWNNSASAASSFINDERSTNAGASLGAGFMFRVVSSRRDGADGVGSRSPRRQQQGAPSSMDGEEKE